MPGGGGGPRRRTWEGELFRATPRGGKPRSFLQVYCSPPSPLPATLWLSKVTLSRSGNQLRASVKLPTSCWANLTYEGSYEAWGEYLVRVRRVSNNQEVSLYPLPAPR